jgi:thiol:disulfide interchange protein DsbD
MNVLLALLLALVSAPLLAQSSSLPTVSPWGAAPAASALPTPFTPQIDRLSASQVRVRIGVPAGHALYRDRLRLVAEDGSGWRVQSHWPVGTRTEDGHEAYRHDLDTVVQVTNADPRLPLRLHLTYQGCEEGRLCYPPQTQIFTWPAAAPDAAPRPPSGAAGPRAGAAQARRDMASVAR